MLQHIGGPMISNDVIPRGLVPHLVSVGGPLQNLIVFSQSVGAGRIMTFDNFADLLEDLMTCSRDKEAANRALSGIRYLRVSNMRSLDVLMHAYNLPHKFEVLELLFWNFMVRRECDPAMHKL